MYQREDHGFGQSGGAGGAVAMPETAFGLDMVAALRLDPLPVHRWRDFDITVDLGARVGSLHWFRGVATLAAMVAGLIHVSPDLRGAFPATTAPADYGKVRALAIAPHADIARRLAATERAEPLTAAPERPQLDLLFTPGVGEGLADVLEREGASHADAARVAALVAQAVPPGDLTAGTRVAITLGRSPDHSVARPLEQVSFRARLDLSLAVRRIAGRLVLDRLPIAVDTTPLRLTGAIGAGLYRSARTAGAPPSVVADYILAIAGRVDIDDLQPDDRYDVIMEQRRAATGEVETGRLLYAGLVHDGKPLKLLRWRLDGREQWLDAAGAGRTREGFTMPVNGQETSGFGMRLHPILGYSRMHQGIDFGAPFGSPIMAVSDGTVRFAGWHGGHGNFVQIAHDGGMGTGYGHMSSFVVAPGEHVQQGQLIGYVGSTGLSTGPHLHFEVYRDGAVIDPATARFAMTSRIGGAALVRFKAALARLTALAPGGAVRTAAVETMPAG